MSESLAEFRAMRDDKYKPQEAVLRMKQNLEDNNPQMWDLAAYRVLDKKNKHHRTGDKCGTVSTIRSGACPPPTSNRM